MNARQKAKKYKQAFDKLNELNNIHNVHCFSYTNLEEVKLCHKISYFPYRERREMIGLKASCYLVEYKDDESHVYTRRLEGGKFVFDDITQSLSDKEKDALIDDLIYAIDDLLKSKEGKER